MLAPTPQAFPKLVSLRSLKGSPGELFDWHDHPFHEFTLVGEGHAEIAYPPGWQPAAPNTLFFYHPRERHGARVGARQQPLFSVVHLEIPETVLAGLEALASKDPEKRVWRLNPDQVETFRWIYFQLTTERHSGMAHEDAVTGHWLSLLLLNVQRWTRRAGGPEISSLVKASPEVRRLWETIQDAISHPKRASADITGLPNYDSVRHAFRRTFGCSPREMLLRLRMEQARNLLLESNLSIKEISERLGYARQHDFYRAFRQRVGCSPSAWRTRAAGR